MQNGVGLHSIYLGRVGLDDPDVPVPLISLEMDLLLVCTDDLEMIALEHVVYDAQEHGDVPQELGGDTLACGVDGHLACSA